MSLADRLRGEEERGVLLQLGRRVAIRVAVHMVRGLRHLSTFRGRRRRCRRVVPYLGASSHLGTSSPGFVAPLSR